MDINPSTNNRELVSRIFEAKKVLFISAHPDDIEFYCGALVYMLRKCGIEVIFAIGTRGGKGKRGEAKRRFEEKRSRYQVDAANVLGGAKIELFNYPDKGLQQHIEPFARDLEALIAREQPDFIFSWDPDYIFNPHPDHRAAAQAGKTAAGDRAIYYGTLQPNLWIGYGNEVHKIKLKALRAHRTEVPWFYYPLVRRSVLKRTRSQGVMAGSEYAETYRSDS